MVRAHKSMEPVPEKISERRVSSPISIPPSKIVGLNQAYRGITESSESHRSSDSPLASPGNYIAIPNLSSSDPNRENHVQALRVLHNGHHDSDESISEILDRLPECSPAFTTVFSELVKIESEKKEKDIGKTPSDLEQNYSQLEEQKTSSEITPTLSRKEMKILRFDLPEMRPRASSHSVGRVPRKKESPSSAHSTPAMSRRVKPKNGVIISKPVNVVPKYKFLTETITVSHEDIVKEQELQERLRNSYPSPKSIFGALEIRSSPH